MRQYHQLLRRVLETGVDRGDRTGTGTRSLFGYQMRFDLRNGFPLVTGKATHLKSIIHELLWFIKGETSVDYLKENNVSIWDEWATEEGHLGPIYGAMWRSWPTAEYYDTEEGVDKYHKGSIDQLHNLIEDLKTNPYSRRHIVTGWNPEYLPDPSKSPQDNALNGKQALPPCHTMFQFYAEPIPWSERAAMYGEMIETGLIEPFHASLTPDQLSEIFDDVGVPKNYLSCQLYQRSGDAFLGIPFNIASYALLTKMVAQCTGMIAKDFVHTLGDVHIYSNHFEQVETYLGRMYKDSPVMLINPEVDDIDGFEYEDFTLVGYDPHPAIKAPISV